MKRFIFFSFLLLINPLLAQETETEGRESVLDLVARNGAAGVYVSLENDTTFMYGEVSMTKLSVSFNNKEGKTKTAKHDKMKWMVVNNRIFLCLPQNDKGSMRRLMEVMAINDKHVLLQYWYNCYYYFIFETGGKIVEDEITVYDRGETIGAEKNNIKALEIVTPYFKGCKVLEAMQSNLDGGRILSEGISNFRCDGAVDLNLILDNFNAKHWMGNK